MTRELQQGVDDQDQEYVDQSFQQNYSQVQELQSLNNSTDIELRRL